MTDALCERFEWVREYAEIKDFGTRIVLSHYPIAHWNGQYQGTVHLFGHVHNNKDYAAFLQYRQMCAGMGIPFAAANVGCMLPYMDYTPRTLEEILTAVSAADTE